MKKDRIEVGAKTIAHVDAHEAAKFLADNWYDNSIDIVDDSEDNVDVDSANIALVEFGIHSEILLADSIRETSCRWAMKIILIIAKLTLSQH